LLVEGGAVTRGKAAGETASKRKIGSLLRGRTVEVAAVERGTMEAIAAPTAHMSKAFHALAEEKSPWLS